MSILGQITEAKKYKINGVDVLIKSPHVDEDIEKLLDGKKDDLPIKERMEMMKGLVKNMLKESIPDATEEELNDALRMKTLLPLMDIFYDVTGMLDEKNTSNAEKIKSAIEQRREAIRNKQAGKKA